MNEDVLYEVHDGVATVTLNRPERLNAVTKGMIRRLIEAFDETDADDSVRAVIVTGAGRGFCAGADLGGGDATFDFTRRDSATAAPRDSGGEFTLRVFRSLKPVIAAINGPAVGFGASLVLPMDFRIASSGAKFGYVFGARGIVPDGAASWFLPKIVGVPTALDWCLTGRVFGPDEALTRGLIRSIEAPDDLLGTAMALAGEIAANTAPVSAALTRQMIWQLESAAHPAIAHRIDSAAIFHTGQRADAKEGVRAFLDRRAPEWTMKPSADMPDWFPWSPEPPYLNSDSPHAR